MTTLTMDKNSVDKNSVDKTTAGPDAQNGAQAERQVVALHLGDEVYGVDIAAINTVLTLPAITPVPKTAPHVAGVINLRGRILPVVDLRSRFGLPPLPAEKKKDARVVIAEVEGLSAGLIVDGVSEVLRLPASAVSPPSPLVSSAETDCITGIGCLPGGRRAGETRNERLILLLDVYKALTTSAQDADALQSLQQAA